MGEHKLAPRYLAPGFTDPVDITFNYHAVRRAFEKHIGYGWLMWNLGPSGVAMRHKPSRYSVIVTEAEHGGVDWIHASVAHEHTMPSYLDLLTLHRGAFAERYAYQLFVPTDKHYSFHNYALHLWGRSDGTALTPDFIAEMGTI